MVASAAMLLREHGVARTSVARVLEHSQGPRGSVQFHFPNGKDELLVEALTSAGHLVTASLTVARDRGDAPADVLAAICEHYKKQLVDTDFRAGCPVGAVSQEAFADPALGPAVASIVDNWTRALSDVLVAAGHAQEEATDLALLCISALEGAISIARVRRSPRPIDMVKERLSPLL